MIRWIKAWFPLLYGIGFTGLLLFLGIYLAPFNVEVWAQLVGPSRGAKVDVPMMVIQSALVVFALGVLVKLLERIDPKFKPRQIVRANCNLYPLTRRWWRWPFALLLMWSLPVLAQLEELIFRHGFGIYPTETMTDIVVRSIGFGLFHALASWNYRGGIVQALLGFWFSYQYLINPVDPVFHAGFAHFLVDLFAFTPGVLALLMTKGEPQSS